MWTFSAFHISRRGSGADQMPLFPHLTQLHGDLSYSFGFIGIILPVSNLFSARFVPHVDVFCVFVEGGESMSSYILIPLCEMKRLILFLSHA